MVETLVVKEIEVGCFPVDPKVGFIEEQVRIKIDEVGIVEGVKGRGGSRKKQNRQEGEKKSEETQHHPRFFYPASRTLFLIHRYTLARAHSRSDSFCIFFMKIVAY